MKIYAQVDNNRSVSLWNLRIARKNSGKNHGKNSGKNSTELVAKNGLRFVLSKDTRALNGL